LRKGVSENGLAPLRLDINDLAQMGALCEI
jgi:hypothetical protein